MKCPSCGKEIADDSKFCEYCGKQLIPTNKMTSEASVHVRWLLFVTTLLLCLLNVSLFYGKFMNSAYGEYSYFDTSTLWIVPVISLAVFVIALILSVKKKLKGIYTIMLFFIFGINTAIPIYAEVSRRSSNVYAVEMNVYKDGEYIGFLKGYHYWNEDSARRNEEVLKSMVRSASRRYRDCNVQFKTNLDYRHSVSAIYHHTCIYWLVEALIMLVYLIMASIASRKEKKQNS